MRKSIKILMLVDPSTRDKRHSSLTFLSYDIILGFSESNLKRLYGWRGWGGGFGERWGISLLTTMIQHCCWPQRFSCWLILPREKKRHSSLTFLSYDIILGFSESNLKHFYGWRGVGWGERWGISLLTTMIQHLLFKTGFNISTDDIFPSIATWQCSKPSSKLFLFSCANEVELNDSSLCPAIFNLGSIKKWLHRYTNQQNSQWYKIPADPNEKRDLKDPTSVPLRLFSCW